MTDTLLLWGRFVRLNLHFVIRLFHSTMYSSKKYSKELARILEKMYIAEHVPIRGILVMLSMLG